MTLFSAPGDIWSHRVRIVLAEKGVEVDWDDNFPGMRRFYAFDLLGNRLEFLEPRQ